MPPESTVFMQRTDHRTLDKEPSILHSLGLSLDKETIAARGVYIKGQVFGAGIYDQGCR